LIATVGMQMNLRVIFTNPGLFGVGATWILIHGALMFLVLRLLRAPLFYLAVGSQANIGAAASAPVVASAFHPSLAPVGVLLAVLGYALGTYAAWVTGQIMRLVATTRQVQRSASARQNRTTGPVLSWNCCTSLPLRSTRQPPGWTVPQANPLTDGSTRIGNHCTWARMASLEPRTCFSPAPKPNEKRVNPSCAAPRWETPRLPVKNERSPFTSSMTNSRVKSARGTRPPGSRTCLPSVRR
jgi:hypothetical protein